MDCIEALHYKKIGSNPECLWKVQRYKARAKTWLPLVTKNVCKFKKNNPEIVDKTLLSSRKGRYIAYRSKFNGKRRKQFNLLMTAHGENRHYKTS